MAIFAKYLYLIDGDQTPMHTNNDPSDEDLESCNQGLLTIIRVGALDSTPHTYFDDEWHPVTERTAMNDPYKELKTALAMAQYVNLDPKTQVVLEGALNAIIDLEAELVVAKKKKEPVAWMFPSDLVAFQSGDLSHGNVYSVPVDESSLGQTVPLYDK